MPRTISFPSAMSAGTLFLADRCYCLDDTMFDWLSDVQGDVSLPDEDFVGIIFKDNVLLRRQVLESLDTTIVKLVFFRNPFELTSLMEVIGGDINPDSLLANRLPGDEECELLAALPGLKAIDLAGARISDEGLRKICTLSSLESLVICDTGVTDDGIKHLSALTELKELDISLNAITSAGLSFLDDLPGLTELRISDVPIDDDAIAHIARLRELTFVDLADTAISDIAMKGLRRALPNCDFWP